MNSHYLQGVEDELKKKQVKIDLEKYKKLLESYEPVETVKELNEQINQVMGVPDVKNMLALPDKSKEFLKWVYPKVKRDREQIKRQMGMTSIGVDEIPTIVKTVINTHHYEKKNRRLLNTIRERYMDEYKNR